MVNAPPQHHPAALSIWVTFLNVAMTLKVLPLADLLDVLPRES